MTLTERTLKKQKPVCEIRSDCQIRANKKFFDALLTTKDKVLVFRRNPSTGDYRMFTACCESILPPPAV